MVVETQNIPECCMLQQSLSLPPSLGTQNADLAAPGGQHEFVLLVHTLPRVLGLVEGLLIQYQTPQDLDPSGFPPQHQELGGGGER